MANKREAAVVLTLLAAAASAAATEAPIQAVTLYPGSATIERAVQVAPGTSQVEITGLLANFSTDTLRVRADAGIQVGQVVTRDQGATASPSPREADLDARIEALEDRIAVIDADAKSAQLAQAYLERLGGTDAGTRPAPLDPKALTGTLDAIRKGGADALVRIHEDEVRKRALVKQLEVLKRELAKAQAGTRDGRVITVQVAAHQAGRLLLSYQVNRAGWKPAYRAALDSNASTVELERLATISQKTGEDWSGVKLRLSTGQPRLSVAAPDPQPWRLTYEPPSPVVAMPVAAAPAPPPAPLAFARRVVVSGSAVEDYIAPVLEVQGNYTTEFDVPASVTLPSDGREISVGLSKLTLAARQRVRIAPRDGADAAVVTAEAARPDGVWIPGQVQLQRDGSYVGATDWNPADGDRFTFAFGRDPLVRVAVEHRDAKSGETGLFKRANERRIDDTYAVTSLHRQPVDVLVLEPTPVSESDQVEVKVALDPAPTVKDWQHRRGLVGWEATLKPNETARFNVDYVIGYPKEGYVSGLP